MMTPVALVSRVQIMLDFCIVTASGRSCCIIRVNNCIYRLDSFWNEITARMESVPQCDTGSIIEE